MIGKCRAIWQVFVLVYGNILLSIGLFSFAFPLVVVGLLLFENSRTYKGTIIFQPTSISQSESDLRTTILYTFGYLSDDVTSDDLKKIVLWRIDAVTLDDAGKPSMSGSLYILGSKNLSVDQILLFLIDSVRKLQSNSLTVVEEKHIPGFLALPSIQLTIQVRNAFRSIPWTSIYRIAFDYTSFLGTRSLEIARGNSLSIQTSAAVPDLALEVQFSDKNIAFFCDDKLILTVRSETGLAKAGACTKWAATREGNLKVEAVTLTSADTSKILVAPFALSSLSMTILIYIVCFLLLYAAFVRAMMPRIFAWRFVQIERIPLTLVASVLLVTFFLPLALLTFVFSLR